MGRWSSNNDGKSRELLVLKKSHARVPRSTLTRRGIFQQLLSQRNWEWWGMWKTTFSSSFPRSPQTGQQRDFFKEHLHPPSLHHHPPFPSSSSFAEICSNATISKRKLNTDTVITNCLPLSPTQCLILSLIFSRNTACVLTYSYSTLIYHT